MLGPQNLKYPVDYTNSQLRKCFIIVSSVRDSMFLSSDEKKNSICFANIRKLINWGNWSFFK